MVDPRATGRCSQEGMGDPVWGHAILCTGSMLCGLSASPRCQLNESLPIHLACWDNGKMIHDIYSSLLSVLPLHLGNNLGKWRPRWNTIISIPSECGRNFFSSFVRGQDRAGIPLRLLCLRTPDFPCWGNFLHLII